MPLLLVNQCTKKSTWACKAMITRTRKYFRRPQHFFPICAQKFFGETLRTQKIQRIIPGQIWRIMPNKVTPIPPSRSRHTWIPPSRSRHTRIPPSRHTWSRLTRQPSVMVGHNVLSLHSLHSRDVKALCRPKRKNSPAALARTRRTSSL